MTGMVVNKNQSHTSYAACILPLSRKSKKCLVICLILFVFSILVHRFTFNDTTSNHERKGTDLQLSQKTENRFIHKGHGPFNFDLSLSRHVEHKTSWKQALKEIASDLRAKPMEYSCINKTWRGNWLDCNTFPFVVKKPCLVYSFGINYEFGPDDAFASLGCDVFSFDPSMGNSTHYIRKSGVHFYPIGIAGISKELFSPRIDLYTKKNPSQKWEIKTLLDIMISMGHENRHLDYLKMDIEFYEWDVIETILRDNLANKIKQFGLEFHIFPDTPTENIVRYLQIYKQFKDTGFRRFDGKLFEYNDNLKSKRMQSDCEFVNLKFDFEKYPVV